MTQEKELIVYTRSTFCPYQAKADRVFRKYSIEPRTIFINQDPEMEARVVSWTGFKSVPTINVAKSGDDMPFEEPVPQPQGESPRGIDRGSMITEANEDQLTAWLTKHGFIES